MIAASSLKKLGSWRLDELDPVGLRAMDPRKGPERNSLAATLRLVVQVSAPLYSMVRRNFVSYRSTVG